MALGLGSTIRPIGTGGGRKRVKSFAGWPLCLTARVGQLHIAFAAKLINLLLTMRLYVCVGILFEWCPVDEMHPSEMKNLALAAAAAAERAGFEATAKAWAEIAKDSALEANALVALASGTLSLYSGRDSLETIVELLSLL
jgi:hypothetical protein